MVRHYLELLRLASSERWGRVGVVLTTSAFVTFIIFQLATFAGLVTNAYFGLILYMALPAVFVLGLLLIPFSLWRTRRRTGKSLREVVAERTAAGELSSEVVGAPLVRTIALLTLVNVVFLAAASMQMLHFMETPRFCGTACHSVMNPEWTTYQDSPHARVACVECHVGEGFDAIVESKMRGAWQMISSAFDLYERPIPTPVHTLRPARETCERCHWPAKFYGHRLQTYVDYADDRTNTPMYTTLDLKIDTGIEAGQAGIHWHIADENTVRYASIDDERETMIWVESLQPDGSWRRFRNTTLDLEPGGDEVVRVMDCVDCHNRATHIYEDPERAVDERMRTGAIDPSLPYIHREAVAALRTEYPTVEAARTGIERALRGGYRRMREVVNEPKLAAAITALGDAYERNIHPEMSIRWGSYPSLIGHQGGSQGCFRCHNADLRTEDGQIISDDCTACHSILAEGSPTPFEFLNPADEKDPDRLRREYLRQEFFGTLGPEPAGRRR
jgi:uncharacterized membrane protein